MPQGFFAVQQEDTIGQQSLFFTHLQKRTARHDPMSGANR